MKANRVLQRGAILALIVCLGLAFTGGASSASQNLILVANLDPDGPGSLIEALEQANNDGMPSLIRFDPALIGGKITPPWLPELWEDNTTIDGDINGDLKPDIEISGESCGGCGGLNVRSSYNLVRGLAINSFQGDGISISGNFNRVEYCTIGTDLGGTLDRGNQGSGISVNDGGSDNTIGPGNIVAFNAPEGGPRGGIAILDGADWDAYPGFEAYTPDYSNLFPALNFPGTSGAFASVDGIMPTWGDGQYFGDTFGARFTGQLDLSASGEYTFAFYYPDDRVGVWVDGAFIGEAGCGTPFGCNDHSETAYLEAGSHTIYVAFWDGPGAAGFALDISGPGSAALSYDGQAGLWGEFFQLRIPSERNRITQNSIFANGRIGIELDAIEYGWGNNILDPGDGDMGPNTALNYPVLTSAVTTKGQTIVKGIIDTANPKRVTLEFFANPVPWPGADPSDHGEGMIFIGAVKVNVQGKFTATLKPVAPGTLITATATDEFGNTSEFALNITAVANH